MKSEILKKLENLLENENILSVQREFKQLSAQFRSLAAHGIAEIDESEEDHEDDNHEDEVNPENHNKRNDKSDLESPGKKDQTDVATDISAPAVDSETEKTLSEEISTGTEVPVE